MGKVPKLSHNQIRELHDFISETKRKGPEVRRAQAVLLLDQGVPALGIKAMTGFRRTRAFVLRKRYLANGVAVLKDRREGRPKELLTRKQRQEIVEIIKTKPPNNVNVLYGEHWTTAILGQYIRDTYKVQYTSRTSLYLIFRKAAFSYHKPGKVSERQDPKEVEAWREKTRPRIDEAWGDTNTVILVEDEMHLSHQTTTQKIWLLKGKYPRIEVARKRESRSIYGFLNVKTGTEHALKTDWQNMYITAEIIPKVRAFYPKQKILLLWDQAGWHRGIEAQKAIQSDGNIETIYFPTAAPEENPQEHVWKNGRSAITHNAFMEKIDTVSDSFVAYLNTTKFPYSLLGFSSL